MTLSVPSFAKRGFTLVELALVLGVIGVIVGAIWFAAGNATTASKAQRAQAQIMQIFGGYKSLYGRSGIDSAGCFLATNDMTCTGVNANFFPADMLQSGVACTTGTTGSYPLNPWGGSVSIQSCKTNQTINITYSGLTQAACNAMANAVYTGVQNMTYQAIYNGVTATWDAQWLLPPPNAQNTPWTTTHISGDCGASSGNAVQIGFAVQ